MFFETIELGNQQSTTICNFFGRIELMLELAEKRIRGQEFNCYYAGQPPLSFLRILLQHLTTEK